MPSNRLIEAVPPPQSPKDVNSLVLGTSRTGLHIRFPRLLSLLRLQSLDSDV
jgi:hypothetical protein